MLALLTDVSLKTGFEEIPTPTLGKNLIQLELKTNI